MDKIRKIIRSILRENESEELQTDFGDKDKARRGFIALSKGLIPSSDIKSLSGSLSSADPNETGHYSEDGEVEINYVFEGTTYTVIMNISGDYYYKEGFGGDYWQPPDEGEWEDEEITLNDDEFNLGDEEDNEYEFHLSELGSEFRSDMEHFLLGFYDASDSSL